jgi:hypothetical protein
MSGEKDSQWIGKKEINPSRMSDTRKRPGGMEAIASIKAIETGIAPPAVNSVERDEIIPAGDFVPDKAIA